MRNFIAGLVVMAVLLLGVLAWLSTHVAGTLTATNEGLATLMPQNYEVQTYGDREVVAPIEQPQQYQEVMATIAAQPLVNAAAPPQPTPTAYFAPATATPEFSPQFLADCALAQGQGRRTHPRCPTNAAEMLGTGR